MAATSSGDGRGGGALGRLTDDILVNIFSSMEEDARHLAMVSCICRRFYNLVRNSCWRNHCMRAMPTIVPELIVHNEWEPQLLGEPPAGWATLFRVLVTCPGLRNTGAFLETWDFGLEREIGSSDKFFGKRRKVEDSDKEGDVPCSSSASQPSTEVPAPGPAPAGHHGPHLASGGRRFSRELGNKLLASRFRTDSLFICDYPGCVHLDEAARRKYHVFRGVFKNFKASHTCRNLRDLKAKKAEAVQCAFCLSGTMWDMVTTFCLRRSLDYHDDGEPVVRAYVCENGHVSGCWTEHW